MNILFNALSVVIGFLQYPGLAKAVVRREVEQNLATFVLWGLLDIIDALAAFKAGGNWYLPAAYVAGCVIVIAALVIARTWSWGWFEWVVAASVVVCIIGLKYSGPRMGVILSTAGVVLAGFPQIKDGWLRPWKLPLMTYVWFTLANACATLGGKAWTVEERLYGASCTVLTLVAAVVIVGRRFFVENQEEVKIAPASAV